MTTCVLAGGYQRFGETNSLHLQGVTTQTTTSNTFTAVKTPSHEAHITGSTVSGTKMSMQISLKNDAKTQYCLGMFPMV